MSGRKKNDQNYGIVIKQILAQITYWHFVFQFLKQWTKKEMMKTSFLGQWDGLVQLLALVQEQFHRNMNPTIETRNAAKEI